MSALLSARAKRTLSLLRAGEFFADPSERGLTRAGGRMRGTEDPSPPLDHVLHDGLGFEHVVACVEIKTELRRIYCATDRV